MPIGAITNYVDVAQLTLYAFWFFFFGLVFWIRREDKREGYPVESLRLRTTKMMQGFPPMPKPKTFTLPHGGGEVVRPGPDRGQPPLNAEPRPTSPVPRWCPRAIRCWQALVPAPMPCVPTSPT
jgi:photosynthetic reaction center H subunit